MVIAFAFHDDAHVLQDIFARGDVASGQSSLAFAPKAPSMHWLPRLDRYLRERLPGLSGDVRLDPIVGGQSNPTFFVTYANRELVLRKQPDVVLPSAHAVDREFRILTALAATAVPVPRALLFCDDREVIGTLFYVMERLHGRVFATNALDGAARDARAPMYASAIETLAVLHAVDVDAAGLAGFGKRGSYFARQIARWTRQYELSKSSANADFDALIAWLPAHVPTDDETAVVHGDYRLGNLMFHPSEPRVAGVLDWELSTLGHPLADLAHHCTGYYMDPSEFGGLRGLDLAELGIPEEQVHVARYVERTGRAPYTAFHMAFALFRFAAICEGIAGRVRTGQAVATDAEAAGRRASALARRAVEVAEGAIAVAAV